jgi:hypothetical protein|uniref:Uncharacterized protein n=1 Tax=viral metagenome TaxID=1070528 RepID=A0A6C0JBI8_9ZZZZ
MYYNIHHKVEYKSAIDELQNDLYQQQFLAAFNVTDYDEHIISSSLSHIIKDLKCDVLFDKLISKVVGHNVLSENIEDSFVFLFSYDYFEDFHKVLNHFYLDGVLSQELVDNITVSS